MLVHASNETSTSYIYLITLIKWIKKASLYEINNTSIIEYISYFDYFDSTWSGYDKQRSVVQYESNTQFTWLIEYNRIIKIS